MNNILSEELINFTEEQLSLFEDSYASFFKQIKEKCTSGDVSRICNYILLNKNDNKLLYETIREINFSKYITNFETLLEFLRKSNNVELKVLAIKTICIYKNTKAVPVLLECLKDLNSNYKVRFAAADALGKIGDKNAFEVLGYVAMNEDEKSAYVKESAVVALGNLGDERAVDVFSSIMSSKQIFLDKFSYLKERILEALSKLDVQKDKRVLEIIKKSLMENSSRVRISAIEALMNIDNEQVYELIYDRLKYDSDLEVRKNALVALYNISDRRILDEVIQNNFDSDLKIYAQSLIDEYEDFDE